MDGTDDLIHRFGERQLGLVTIEQLTGAGVPDAAVRRRVESGRLVRCSPRVLRIAGSPDSRHQRVLAAVLDGGPLAAAARHTALALWGLPGHELDPPAVLRAYDRRGYTPTLGVHHTTRDLRPHHVAELYGIPVCTAARALVDLAGTVPYVRLERICDRAWSWRLLSGPALHEIVGELAGRGRRGSADLRRLCAERPADHVPPESNLEARFAEVLRSAGEPALERQVDLGDDDDWLGRVDFLDRGLRIVFEVQSDLFHTSVSDRRRDRERRARLEAAGWTVVEIAEFDIWHRPDRVVLAVRAARRAARARRAA